MSKDKRPRYEREQPRIVPPLSDGRMGVCAHCGKQHQHEPTWEQPERCLHQRGSVVLPLMLLSAVVSVCLSWLAVDGTDHPPPLRPYPVATGNDPDPPPRRSDWMLQRECMREYRRTKRPTN